MRYGLAQVHMKKAKDIGYFVIIINQLFDDVREFFPKEIRLAFLMKTTRM